MNKKKFLAILILVLIAFILRLYRINYPLADWHSWRQADTAAVSRNFIKHGFDVLYPCFDDLSNIPSGKDNPEGYRFVEFPIYNLIHAFLSKQIGFFNLEVWGRLLSVFFSLLSLVFLFFIVEFFINGPTAFLAGLFFAVLPFNVYYSRVILPEPMMVSMMLGSIWFIIKFKSQQVQKFKSHIYLFISVIFAVTAILLKPFAGFIIFPSIFYIFFQEKKSLKFSILSSMFYILISICPFLLWRWWAGHFPEGVPANIWLLNAGGIRLRPAWFRWLFAERLAKLILGYWGVVFFALGMVIKKTKKEGWFFYYWLIGGFIYLAVVARGNIQHDYYQILLIPLICVFLAKGVRFFLSPPEELNKGCCLLFTACCLLATIGFSWFHVKDFFNINNPKMIIAGKRADKILPKDAKVIAPLGGDSAFLYQTNRKGWPQGIEIEKLIKKGATHYVNFNFGPETEYIESSFCVLEKTENYIIAQLKKCK